jgi:hypothetical protein
MSAYATLLEIAREQAAALTRDDVVFAVSLLDKRAELLASAPHPSEADRPLVEEIMRLDRQLATAIRERMLWIREQLLAASRGRTALASYKPWRRSNSYWLDKRG